MVPFNYTGAFRAVYKGNSPLNANQNIISELRKQMLCGFTLSHLARSYLSKKTIPNTFHFVHPSFHDVHCGIFDKSGDRFFCASVDGYVSIFDFIGCNLRMSRRVKFNYSSNGAISTVQSPDQQRLVLSSNTEGVEIISLQLKEERIPNVYILTDRKINCTAHCGNSNIDLLCGSPDLRTSILDLNTQQFKEEFSDKDFKASVRTVAWLQDGESTFVTGSDDICIRKFDARTSMKGPVAYHLGHLDGVVYIDSKNDGRYFLSNSKDQTVRLWDVRLSVPICELNVQVQPLKIWDFETQRIPSIYLDASTSEASNCSRTQLVLRGHRVRYTEIRAKFSPLVSTGQQFAYSGCANGGWVIWDLTKGEMIAHHRTNMAVVRDVAWHPWQTLVITSALNGELTGWNFLSMDVPSKSESRILVRLENPHHNRDMLQSHLLPVEEADLQDDSIDEEHVEEGSADFDGNSSSDVSQTWQDAIADLASLEADVRHQRAVELRRDAEEYRRNHLRPRRRNRPARTNASGGQSR